MPFRFLLDTNIVSDLVRNPKGVAANRIAEVGEDAVCTSIIVASELRYGAVKSGSERLAERIDLILSALEVLPLKPPVDDIYAELRNDLARRGKPIGPNDMLIASHALAGDLTLVTANTREFKRVKQLRLENWLRR